MNLVSCFHTLSYTSLYNDRTGLKEFDKILTTEKSCIKINNNSYTIISVDFQEKSMVFHTDSNGSFDISFSTITRMSIDKGENKFFLVGTYLDEVVVIQFYKR